MSASGAWRRTWTRASTWPSTSSATRPSPSPNGTGSGARRSPPSGRGATGPRPWPSAALLAGPLRGGPPVPGPDRRHDRRRRGPRLGRPAPLPRRALPARRLGLDRRRRRRPRRARRRLDASARRLVGSDRRAAGAGPPAPIARRPADPPRPSARRPPGGRAGRPRRHRAGSTRTTLDLMRPQPDPRRPVHLAAQRDAPRAEGVDLRRPELLRRPPRRRAVRGRPRRPERPASPRRWPTSSARSRPCSATARRPLAELDDARRSLLEGQARHFETPSDLVSRFAGLFLHGLPPDHHATFPERLAAVDLDRARRRRRPPAPPRVARRRRRRRRRAGRRAPRTPRLGRGRTDRADGPGLIAARG